MGISLSQKFIICALGGRGGFNCYNPLLIYGLISAALIELQDGGAIVVRDKYAEVIGPPPSEKPWLRKTYESLSDPMNESKISETIRRLYSPLFTDKRVRVAIEEYLTPLVEKGIVKEGKRTLAFRKSYAVHPWTLERLRHDIECQIKDSQFNDAEILTLILLLRHSKFMNKVVPCVSGGDLRKFYRRIEEIGQGPIGAAVERNKDVIASVSFAASFLGGGLF